MGLFFQGRTWIGGENKKYLEADRVRNLNVAAFVFVGFMTKTNRVGRVVAATLRQKSGNKGDI